MPDESPLLTRKIFDPVESQFTPGERSMVAWISTDRVDHERDVVVSSGIDYKTYFMGKTPEEGNPCVLAFHDLGRWPLGRCEWVKVKQSRDFNGLFAKTIFDEDPETEAVWRKIKSGSLRGISIGFRPPEDLKPGEWGPPTQDELRRRPDWKGAERIIRRCVLLEYSVCSLPMNPQALVAAVNKGVHRPVFSIPKAPTMAQSESPPEATETEEEKACECGKADCKCDKSDEEKACTCGKSECEKCSGMAEGSGATGGATVKPKADEPDEDEEDEEDEDLESKAMGDEDEPEPEDAEEAEEEEEDDDPDEIGPLKRYDHVSVKAPHYKGVGRIESMHTCGHVPHSSNHMMGTKDDPAACVKCYRKMGDGHVATDDHVAVKLAHITKLGTPLRAPSKKSAPLVAKKTVRTEPIVEPLPEIRVKSDQEVQAELIAKLNHMLSPEGFRKIAREEAERAAGYV